MKIKSKIILASFLVVFGLLIFCGILFYHFSYKITNYKIYSSLQKIVNIRREKILEYFDNEINNLKYLASLGVIRDFLNQDLLDQQNSTQEKIQNISNRVADEANNYILAHPDKTVLDLQNDPKFQKIALQTFGQTGYTAIAERDSLISRFHKNPAMVNFDFNLLEDKLPDFVNILKNTQKNLVEGGFYNWQEEDGSLEKKYLHITNLTAPTADDIFLSVAATSYLREFASINRVDFIEEYLDDFIGYNNYADLFLVNPLGNVLYNHSGNVENKILNNVKCTEKICLTDIFLKVRQSYNYFISDINLDEAGNPFFYIGIPLFQNEDQNDLVGILIAKEFTHELERIVNDYRDEQINHEVYIIGNDYLMRTSSKVYGSESILRDKGFQTKIQNCFQNAKSYVDKDFLIYKNYSGTRVIGAYAAIPKLSWTLIGEINYREALRDARFVFFIAAFSGIGSVGVCLLILYILINRILSPINKLLTSTVKIRQGELDTKITTQSNDEIGELATHFDKMRQALKEKQAEIDKQIKSQTKEIKSQKKELENQKKALLNILEDLNDSYDRVSQLSNVKSEFLRVVSHQFRTPLSQMRWSLEILLESKHASKKILKSIAQNNYNLINSLNSVLLASEITDEKIFLKKQELSISDLIELAVEEKNNISSTNIQYIKPKDNLAEINLDENLIKQVVRILLNNACDYNIDAKEVNIALSPKKLEDTEYQVITVRDYGIGINKKEIDKIFDKFYRGAEAIKTKANGTGLNLFIAKSIVELHEGLIKVSSSEEEGTVFEVWFKV